MHTLFEHDPLVIHKSTQEVEPGVFYAANNRGIFRSVDTGPTWEALPIPWPQDTKPG